MKDFKNACRFVKGISHVPAAVIGPGEEPGDVGVADVQSSLLAIANFWRSIWQREDAGADPEA